MAYTIERLKHDLLARLGEITRSQTSLSIPDIPSTEDIVGIKAESILPYVGKRMILNSPQELLGSGEKISTGISIKKTRCGLYGAEITLPDGFLRLENIKMTEWSRQVCRLILQGSQEWACQWSEEKGIAGCPEYPKAYLDGDIVRAIGSVEESDTLECFRCWRVPEPNEMGEFYFPEALYPDLVSEIATAIIEA